MRILFRAMFGNIMYSICSRKSVSKQGIIIVKEIKM